MGHYATNFPLNKSKNGSSERSEGEALGSQFEMDFTLIACMMSSMMGYGWFLDSGASFHMTDDSSLFSTLEEKDLKMRIEMGDDERYSVLGVGMVAFQREHGAFITLTDVKNVLGLKINKREVDSYFCVFVVHYLLYVCIGLSIACTDMIAEYSVITITLTHTS